MPLTRSRSAPGARCAASRPAARGSPRPRRSSRPAPRPRRPPGAGPSRCRVQAAKVSTTSIGLSRRKPGCRRSTQAAIQAKKSRSRAICRSMPGPQDLDRDLLARAGHARSAPGRSRRRRPAGRRSSRTARRAAGRARASIIWRASAPSNGGRSSCSCDRSAASSWPSRSDAGGEALAELDEARARAPAAPAPGAGPGRPGASWRDSRRARRSTGSGSGSRSSGNSALWRARQRAMPISRQRCRTLRSMAACLETPGRVDRRDAAGQIAIAHALRARPARSCARRSPGPGKRRMLSTRYR